jgi:hypothetical protein
VRFRLVHVPLLAFALGTAVVGARVIARGLFHRSYDNTVWNYAGVAVPLLLVAVVLIVFVLRDARDTGSRGRMR